jgi:hypothetical protein
LLATARGTAVRAGAYDHRRTRLEDDAHLLASVCRLRGKPLEIVDLLRHDEDGRVAYAWLVPAAARCGVGES